MKSISKRLPINSQPVFLVLVFIFLLAFAGKGQEIKNKEERYVELGAQFVKEGQYAQAMPFFQELLSQYQKDPDYNYYYGLCLLKTGKSLESIPYLRYSSTQKVPPEVYFHLGNAYQLNYHFGKAVGAYNKYILYGADENFIKQAKRARETCNNGDYLVKYAPATMVLKKEEHPAGNFYQQYKNMDIGGKFSYKPSRFLSTTERKNKSNTVFFVPHHLETGEYLYYSSYQEDDGENKSRDLFRVKKTGTNRWGTPEPLGEAINTPYDEEYPYIMPDGKTLYFCSKGHYSMGGYDIYKSVFEPVSQSWTPPENLDFPINSPYDDMLFVPDVYGNKALFASNREGKPGQVNLYTILLSGEREQVAYDNPGELRKTARLSVATKDTDQVIGPGKTSTPNLEKIEAAYQELLDRTLELQRQKDSCTRSIVSMENTYRQAEDDDYKKNLYREINLAKGKSDSLHGVLKENYQILGSIERQYLEKEIERYKPTAERPEAPSPIKEFMHLVKVQDVLGAKGMEKLQQLNQDIKALENSSTKKSRKIYRKIQKCKQKIPGRDGLFEYLTKRRAHGLTQKYWNEQQEKTRATRAFRAEKYQLYKKYLPLARIKATNALYIEYANDMASKAEELFLEAGLVEGTVKPDDPGQTIVEKINMADSLNQASLDLQEMAFLTYLGYEIQDMPIDKELEKTKTALAEKEYQEILDSLMALAPKKIIPPENVEKNQAIDSSNFVANTLLEEEKKMEKQGPRVADQFKLLDQSPYNDANPIPFDKPTPPGIVYRVQLGVFSRKLKPGEFGGLHPLRGEKVEGKNLYKYYTGELQQFQLAKSALMKVKAHGFPDAYIVAYHDGEKININQAMAMEKQRPSIKKEKTAVKENRQTIAKKTDKLNYRVQIGVFRGSMPEDIIQSFQKIIPGEKIEYIMNDGGLKIYTLGNFTSYRQADKARDKLVAHGHQGVFVAAFKNNKKIPLPK
jgi:hypothetical protein